MYRAAALRKKGVSWNNMIFSENPFPIIPLRFQIPLYLEQTHRTRERLVLSL